MNDVRKSKSDEEILEMLGEAANNYFDGDLMLLLKTYMDAVKNLAEEISLSVLQSIEIGVADMQTAQEMLEQTLKENCWDGLANPDIECGCGIDDFAPCGQIERGCCPAKGSWETGFYTYEAADNSSNPTEQHE